MTQLEPVQCDYCGYNVAFCTGARCPECGQLLYCRRPMSAEMRRAVLVLSLLVTISAYPHVAVLLSWTYTWDWCPFSFRALSHLWNDLVSHPDMYDMFDAIRLLVIFALVATTWTLWSKLGRPGQWPRSLIFLNLLVGLLALILAAVEHYEVTHSFGHMPPHLDPSMPMYPSQYTPFMIAHGLWLVMWSLVFNYHNKKLEAGRPEAEERTFATADSP